MSSVLRAALATALIIVALPAAAHASTATLEAGIINVRAAAGESNSVSVATNATSIVVRDAGIRARTGCRQVAAIEVHCASGQVNVALGNGNDSFVAQSGVTTAVDAGPGDDSYVQNITAPGITTIDKDNVHGDVVNCGDGDDQAFVPPSTSLRECERTPFIGELDPARL
jgi:hypothetical protein